MSPAVRIAIIAVVGIALAAGGAFYFAPKTVAGLRVAVAALLEYQVPMRVSVEDGNHLTVKMSGSKLSADSATRARFANSVAKFVVQRFPQAPDDSVRSVTVVFDGDPAVRGAGRFRWTPAQLRQPAGAAQLAAAPAPATKTPAAPGTKTPAPATKGSAPATKTTVAAAGSKAPAPANVAQANVTPAGAPVRPAPPARAPSAFERFAASDPAATWNRGRTVVGDVDCDSRADTVAVGIAGQEVHVALARAADPVPQILVFDIAGGVDSAGKRLPGIGSARIALESLDFEPAERGLAGVEGLRRSRTCSGVLLGDRNQDPVHLVWSQKTQHIEWYRLPPRTARAR
jgi:hypothetical protein